MSKEEINKNEIDEEKREQIISLMKLLRDKREAEIEESELDINIIDVQYLGTINWLDERNGENEEKQKDIFVIIEERKGQTYYKYYDEELKMIAVQMHGKDEILPSEEYTFKKDKSFLKDIEGLEEKESLNKIEEEERLSEEETEKGEEIKPQKPKNVIQYIDVDKAYVDDKTTFRKAYGIPHGVEELAIRPTNNKDKNPLSSDTTMDMLDNKGNVVEKVKQGEKRVTINDLFKVDDATGNNPMYDDNTKLELDKTAEKNKSQTIGRFVSKINNSLYLSVERQKVGGYPEVYSGRKTKDGNDPVEMQLETRNEPIQTSLEMQKINRKARGTDSADDIDHEADFHEKHGDDTDNIAKENADGKKETHEICENDFIPGTDTTWQEFANKCGYRGEGSIENAQKKFIEYQNENTQVNNQELIEMIEEDLNEQMGNGTIEKSLY